MKSANTKKSQITYVGGRRSGYPVFTTTLGDLAEEITPHLSGAGRILAVVDDLVYSLHRKTIDRLLERLPTKAELIRLPISESKKNAKSLLSLIDKIIASGADRSSIVLAIGGGVTTDVAGCAAALSLRGIRWGATPTTLLGMVDASIGGKTGVNTNAGKNLLGAFWNPDFVALAPEFTATQKTSEFRDGLGEVLKYVAICNRPSLSAVGRALEGRDNLLNSELVDLVFRSAKVKSMIVSKDHRERGVRVWLNFGHTLAHALESAAGYGSVSHGRAVAAGMIGALEISEAFGLESDSKIDRIRSCASAIAIGKPVSIDEKSAFDALVFDKKRSKGDLNFVLLRSVGEPYLQAVSDRRLIRRSLRLAIKSLQDPILRK